jgi:hypothetical protein
MNYERTSEKITSDQLEVGKVYADMSGNFLECVKIDTPTDTLCFKFIKGNSNFYCEENGLIEMYMTLGNEPCKFYKTKP